MKYVFIVLFLLRSFTSADEIQRIESVVQEISQLEKKLQILEIELAKQKYINQKLEKKIRDRNVFPNLSMKESFTRFKARSFRINKESAIYDTVEGTKLFTWEDGTSFTSHIRAQKWIKITGYFVNKVWKKADKELWIQEKNTILRK